MTSLLMGVWQKWLGEMGDGFFFFYLLGVDGTVKPGDGSRHVAGCHGDDQE